MERNIILNGHGDNNLFVSPAFTIKVNKAFKDMGFKKVFVNPKPIDKDTYCQELTLYVYPEIIDFRYKFIHTNLYM